MKFKFIHFIKLFVAFLSFFLLLIITFYFFERRNETYYEYKDRSVFYQLMRKKNKFDFIKTAEKELENINNYLEKYNDDKSLKFRIFLTEEKLLLVQEIQQSKLISYCKEGGIKSGDKPSDFKTLEKAFPELIIKFNDYGKIIEYNKIDYLKIFNIEEEKARRKVSKEFLEYFDLGNFHRAELKKISEVLGAEYFGLTVNRLYQNFPEKNFEEGAKCVENERRLLLIHNGVQDLFYDMNRIGNISTRKDNDKLICSLKFENFTLKDSSESKELIFELKKNKDEYPYYSCTTDKWVYLIYPGISACYYPLFLEKYCNTPYLPSQDYLHPFQKKYVLIQCRKDFFSEFDSFYYLFEDNIINKIMFFYQ